VLLIYILASNDCYIKNALGIASSSETRPTSPVEKSRNRSHYKKNLAISKKKIWLAVAELGLNPNSATLKPISMKNVIARLLGNLRTVSAEVSR
jgi:hypothetical protein